MKERAMPRGRQRDVAVAEHMGYRVEEGFGEPDPGSGRLVFTHGTKDFKESEACICEQGLFRLLPGVGGGDVWEEVPHFTAATDPGAVEECLVWLRTRPGVRPGLRWKTEERVWECWAEVAVKPRDEWDRATSAVVGDAVTAVLLQVAGEGVSILAVRAD